MSIKLEAGTLTSIATTGLNSLASTQAALSDEFDNSSAGNLFIYASFELYLASAAFTGTPRVDAYMICAMDGTNYSDNDTGASPYIPANSFIGSFFPHVETAAQRLVLGVQHPGGPIMLPPSKIKIMLVNVTGVAFASSGNTLKILPFRYQ
jgi:hypothetical protein